MPTSIASVEGLPLQGKYGTEAVAPIESHVAIYVDTLLFICRVIAGIFLQDVNVSNHQTMIVLIDDHTLTLCHTGSHTTVLASNTTVIV